MARDVCIENGSTDFKIIRIISVIIVTISLIIILCLGCVSINQFTKLKKLESTFQRLFHIVWISSTCALITFLISITLCAYGHPYSSGNIIVIQAWLICITILCILLTLLFRLYFTFKDTTYALNPTMKWLLIILYTLLLIVSVFNLILMSYAYVHRHEIKIKYIPVIWLGAIMGIIYISTTIIAIVQFAQKLMKLAETRATSIEMLKHGPNINGHNKNIPKMPVIQLNKHQIKLIEHTTKYVGLLSIGILTSICTLTILMAAGDAFGENWNMEWFQIAYIFASCDATINTTCLYLQYAFAKQCYDKYCKCIHLSWRYVLTQEAEKSLSRRYQRVLSIEASKHDHEDTSLPLKPDGTYDT